MTRPRQSTDSASSAAERLRLNPCVHLTLHGGTLLQGPGGLYLDAWASSLSAYFAHSRGSETGARDVGLLAL